MKNKTPIVIAFIVLSAVFVATPFSALADPPGVAASGDQGVQPQNGYNTASSIGTGTAAGLGSCGAALFAKALVLLGFSTGAASLGISASIGGNVPVGLPVTDTGTHIGLTGVNNTSAASTISNNLSAGGTLTQLFNNDLLGCIARAIARALIQQTVNGVVNWIRSGFNGSPAFVADPTTFFTNVANTAAGNFLNSSGLAFLCSPYALQVKIAIAQAYSGYGNNFNSCNLIGNWTGFMNNFQNGGWSSFISMTSNPNNQPFGAYLNGYSGLQAAVANAQNTYSTQLQQSGGFLNFTQNTNCKTYNSPQEVPNPGPNQTVKPITNSVNGSVENTQWQLCNTVTQTPGTVINSELSKAVGMNLDELNLAKNFDEIISALITTLMQRVLSGGLLTLGTGSNTTDYASSFGSSIPNDAVTGLISQAMSQIPGYLSSAQTLQGIYNQDISNVQSALTTANSVVSCWESIGHATSTADITTLNQYLSTYQSNLQSANASVTSLQNYQSQFSNTTDINSLNNLVVQFTNAMAAGTFPDQGAISGANEDQLGLTTNLATINQNESAALSACQAAGGSISASSTPITAVVTPSCSLNINPASVYQGSPTTISWASTNADSGTIISDAGDSLSAAPASSGSQTITPSQSSTYTGTFVGAGGAGTCTASVVVTPVSTSADSGG